jgi:hypothetical protein
MEFSRRVLDMDTEAEAERIRAFIWEQAHRFYRRKGTAQGSEWQVRSAG